MNRQYLPLPRETSRYMESRFSTQIKERVTDSSESQVSLKKLIASLTQYNVLNANVSWEL